MTDSTDKADLEKRPEQVSAMFDKVSRRYDLTNDVLTFGIDRLWRVATTRALAPKPGERILDLAAGTGTSSVSFAKSGAYVVAGDFSEGMLEEGRRRYGHIPNVEFAWADATELPFSDDSFDAVTISWGLRNVVDPHKALEEMLRVTRPGGRLVVCEFSTPPNALFRRAYRFYNDAVMPLFVRIVSSDAAAYDYLDESIRHWPAQRELASWLRDAGWEKVAYRDLTGGIAALHRGVKPHA